VCPRQMCRVTRRKARCPASLFASPQGVDPLAPNDLIFEAATRNKTRLEQANIEDENGLGEPKHCCSFDPTVFLPAPVVGPDDTFSPPTWFLRKTIVMAATPAPTPTESSVRFDVSPEAAEHKTPACSERSIATFNNFSKVRLGPH
jgi:hypothetical protein